MQITILIALKHQILIATMSMYTISASSEDNTVVC